jgi:pyruvate formate-lyase activating enzyme-like uncharacterized protein
LTLNMKNQDIRSVRQEVGWIYPKLKWLTAEEATLASEDRSRLLTELSGKVNEGYSQTKLYKGALSPGCAICGDGTWSCQFINGLCTANCFFCPQDRGMKEERNPTADGIVFRSPKDYADFVRKVGYRGVGFSGGEPLLVYDTLLSFIEELRDKVGDEIYLWAYTNGDLADRQKLRGLKEAGLNEIRFNIAARGYDLRPAELALGFIDTVTVEIPAIPEDFEVIKGAISIMENMGVHHLNLHQLLTTECNYANMIQRGYSLLHHPMVPVLETEMTALKLLIFVLEKGISLPINYCSAAYKYRFQGRGNRMRAAPFVKEGLEEITESGYIRRITIKGSPERLKNLAGYLAATGSSGNQWSLSEDRTALAIHPSLLEHVEDDDCKFNLSYFVGGLTETNTPSSLRPDDIGKGFVKTAPYEFNSQEGLDDKISVREVILNPGRTLFAVREQTSEHRDLSLMAVKGFQKLFIEKMNEREVFRWFSENYDITSKEKIKSMGKEKTILAKLKAWEQTPEGFPEIY